MSRLIQPRAQKSGLPPGSLVHIGEKKVDVARISIIEYDEKTCTTRDLPDFDHCKEANGRPTMKWINVDGVHEPAAIETLGRHFNLHPLLMEDVMNTSQRPKVEDYGDVLFIVLKMLFYDDKEEKIMVEQVSLVLGGNFVITFQEKEEDVFEGVRERLLATPSRLRSKGVDYLAYALIDAVVDNYFIVLERFGDFVEEIEDNASENPTAHTVRDIHVFKRETLYLRKAIWPVREVVGYLEKSETQLIASGTKLYLRDVYDHVVQAVETVENLREVLSSVHDVYLSSLSNRMNQVMKVLAIISTIFIPLTFVAGVYGMNFEDMPELRWRYGYPVVLATMGVIALALVVAFRRKRWI